MADASGNGNNGTVANTTWATTGKYGKALCVQRHELAGHDPRLGSLHLTTGMTLEAWVNPSTVNANWRDVIYKGNDNYYLEATSTNASGRTRAGSPAAATATRSAPPRCRRTPGRSSTETYDGTTSAPVRQRHPGRVHRPHRHDHHLDQPAPDRRRQHLRPVLRRDDRRCPRLQHRAHRRPDPDRHDHPRQPDRPGPGAPGNLTATAVSGRPRSTSPGAPPPSSRRHRLPGRALQGSQLHQLRPDRDTDRDHHLQRHHGLTPNTSYSYRVRASDAANEHSARTPTPPPRRPGSPSSPTTRC